MTIDNVYTAIKFNDLVSVETYLKSIIYVSYPVLRKVDSFLIYAVNYGELDMLKLLVNYGAQINRSWDGAFLLEYAIQRGNIEMMDYLRTGITDNNRKE